MLNSVAVYYVKSNGDILCIPSSVNGNVFGNLVSVKVDNLTVFGVVGRSPAVKRVAVLLRVDTLNGVAVSEVSGSNRVTTVGLEGNFVRLNEYALRIVRDFAVNHLNNGYGVVAFFGKSNGSVVGGNVTSVSAVYSDTVSACANDASPADNTVVVRNSSKNVGNFYCVAVKRICALFYCFNRDGKGAVNLFYRVGGVGYFEFRFVNLYLVARCTLNCRPGNGLAVSGNAYGSGKSGLGEGKLCFGRIVAVCYCGYGSGVFACAVILERESGVLSNDFVVTDRNYVVLCVCNCVPNKSSGSLVNLNARNGRKVSLVAELLGYGRSVAFSGSGYGKLNSAFLHRAVGEIVSKLIAVVEVCVLVSLVTAIYRNVVVGCTGYCVIGKNAVRYFQAGYAVKRFVLVVSGVGLTTNGYVNYVIASLKLGKVVRVGRTTSYVVGVDDLAVFLYFNLVVGRSTLFRPGDGGRRNGYVSLVPYCVKSGVRAENVLVVLISKLACVLVVTYPPADKLVALFGGNGYVKRHTADGGSGANDFTVTYERNCVLRIGRSHETSVDGYVASNGVTERVLSIKTLIGVPTNENLICFCGICRLFDGCAFSKLSVLHISATIRYGIVGDGGSFRFSRRARAKRKREREDHTQYY